MRYLCIPEPIALIDLLTGEPVKDSPQLGLPSQWYFQRTGLLVCMSIARKQAMEGIPLGDLRKKLSKPPGTWIELTEPEHTALETEVRKPSAELFPPLVILQMESHIAPVLDAPRDKPPALAALDNGAPHASA